MSLCYPFASLCSLHLTVCVFVVVLHFFVLFMLCLFTVRVRGRPSDCVPDSKLVLPIKVLNYYELVIVRVWSSVSYRYVHIKTNQVSCARGLLRSYNHDLYPDEKSVREAVIKDALIHRSMADESLSHNVFDNQRQRDNNEILSGPAIDGGTELTHTFHSGPRRRHRCGST